MCFNVTTFLRGSNFSSNVNLSSSLPRKRNRFLNEKNSPDAIERNDLIDTIKFIGRQHSFLTGIVDLINLCFTFEVYFNPFGCK